MDESLCLVAVKVFIDSFLNKAWWWLGL